MVRMENGGTFSGMQMDMLSVRSLVSLYFFSIEGFLISKIFSLFKIDKQKLPICEHEDQGGKYPELKSKEQLESALDWFCKLEYEEIQNDFLTCS